MLAAMFVAVVLLAFVAAGAVACCLTRSLTDWLLGWPTYQPKLNEVNWTCTRTHTHPATTKHIHACTHNHTVISQFMLMTQQHIAIRFHQYSRSASTESFCARLSLFCMCVCVCVCALFFLYPHTYVYVYYFSWKTLVSVDVRARTFTDKRNKMRPPPLMPVIALKMALRWRDVAARCMKLVSKSGAACKPRFAAARSRSSRAVARFMSAWSLLKLSAEYLKHRFTRSTH